AVRTCGEPSHSGNGLSDHGVDDILVRYVFGRPDIEDAYLQSGTTLEQGVLRRSDLRVKEIWVLRRIQGVDAYLHLYFLKRQNADRQAHIRWKSPCPDAPIYILAPGLVRGCKIVVNPQMRHHV